MTLKGPMRGLQDDAAERITLPTIHLTTLPPHLREPKDQTEMLVNLRYLKRIHQKMREGCSHAMLVNPLDDTGRGTELALGDGSLLMVVLKGPLHPLSAAAIPASMALVPIALVDAQAFAPTALMTLIQCPAMTPTA
ncbi:hypothetical protein PV08_06317 [Exophiala spinifera]|uniref:Uncharacterized protein n=1 Tax=Exophiala spinifera TaxID=91928 RepID=A0A0D1YMJ7_9EURO|nr:uncharacterized protein PV08_06317 [Exophiala spinifera]KIW16266.1 hypothetical protein PV08_06317 [Exophiala spinifera]